MGIFEVQAMCFEATAAAQSQRAGLICKLLNQGGLPPRTCILLQG